jgi:hypothetical protein
LEWRFTHARRFTSVDWVTPVSDETVAVLALARSSRKAVTTPMPNGRTANHGAELTGAACIMLAIRCSSGCVEFAFSSLPYNSTTPDASELFAPLIESHRHSRL